MGPRALIRCRSPQTMPVRGGDLDPYLGPSYSFGDACDFSKTPLRRGGDEETRTPDPLLAKEMLCRLSYVPSHRNGEVWWAFLDSNQRPLPYQGSALTS